MKAHRERCKLVRPTLPVLPGEIIVEILLRLPVKALLRFKRVCKSWRTLISSPKFAMDNFRQHSSANRNLPSHLIYSNKHYEYQRLGLLSLQPLFEATPSGVASFVHFGIDFCIGEKFGNDELIIRGSCNGLLCLHHLPSSRFCLLNPATKSVSRCFRSELGPPSFYFGFGYDHVHDKYKLVTVHGHEQDLTQIFTFGANSWTNGPKFPYPVYAGLTGKIGRFLSGTTGTLNWMAKVKEWVIISFDLANETFGEVSLPCLSGVDHNTRDPELQVSLNCLSFTIQKETMFEVWMMKEHGVWESWIMISRVNLLRHYYNNLIPLFISERYVLLLVYPFVRTLVMYNCDDGMFSYPLMVDTSDGCILSATHFQGKFYAADFVHHESLVSPPQ
ncbi:hypothetical protein PIB30_024391 [Stylosanthes scabra]|uniref:F-box domain-containing protein n=1 Tax=Stylosanthes scabra TaxID=79078 RepID=A0ABU6S9R2_9FABA|nr:hypothetical protein [Stylosanthes scabra]